MFGVEEETGKVNIPNNYIGRNEECPLQVITPAIKDQEVHYESSDKQADSLEQCEVKGHVLVHAPAQDHN